MAQKSNLLPKTTPLHLWTSKVQNASRASSAFSCIMRNPWIISYSLASVPSDHSRPPPHSAQMKPLEKFWITAPLTPQMAFSIALATWSSVHILTQGSKMRAREAEDMKNLMVFASVRSGPFHRGMASFSERKVCSLDLLRPLLSLWNPVSECAQRTMSLER